MTQSRGSSVASAEGSWRRRNGTPPPAANSSDSPPEDGNELQPEPPDISSQEEPDGMFTLEFAVELRPKDHELNRESGHLGVGYRTPQVDAEATAVALHKRPDALAEGGGLLELQQAVIADLAGQQEDLEGVEMALQEGRVGLSQGVDFRDIRKLQASLEQLARVFASVLTIARQQHGEELQSNLEVSVPDSPNAEEEANIQAQLCVGHLTERLAALLPDSEVDVLGLVKPKGCVGGDKATVALLIHRTGRQAEAGDSSSTHETRSVIQDVTVCGLDHANGKSSMPSVLSSVLKEVYGPLPPGDSAEERWKQVNVETVWDEHMVSDKLTRKVSYIGSALQVFSHPADFCAPLWNVFPEELPADLAALFDPPPIEIRDSEHWAEVVGQLPHNVTALNEETERRLGLKLEASTADEGVQRRLMLEGAAGLWDLATQEHYRSQFTDQTLAALVYGTASLVPDVSWACCAAMWHAAVSADLRRRLVEVDAVPAVLRLLRRSLTMRQQRRWRRAMMAHGLGLLSLLVVDAGARSNVFETDPGLDILVSIIGLSLEEDLEQATPPESPRPEDSEIVIESPERERSGSSRKVSTIEIPGPLSAPKRVSTANVFSAEELGIAESDPSRVSIGADSLECHQEGGVLPELTEYPLANELLSLVMDGNEMYGTVWRRMQAADALCSLLVRDPAGRVAFSQARGSASLDALCQLRDNYVDNAVTHVLAAMARDNRPRESLPLGAALVAESGSEPVQLLLHKTMADLQDGLEAMLYLLRKPPKAKKKRPQGPIPVLEETTSDAVEELTEEEQMMRYLQQLQEDVEAELVSRGAEHAEVTLDLPAMKIETDEPQFVNSDSKFKKPKAAKAQIDQIASVLSALATVLARRGQPQLRLTLEGRTTAKDKAKELADQRTQACRGHIMASFAELGLPQGVSGPEEVLVDCRGITSSRRKSLTFVVAPFDLPPEPVKALTPDEEEELLRLEALKAEETLRAAEEERQRLEEEARLEAEARERELEQLEAARVAERERLELLALAMWGTAGAAMRPGMGGLDMRYLVMLVKASYVAVELKGRFGVSTDRILHSFAGSFLLGARDAKAAAILMELHKAGPEVDPVAMLQTMCDTALLGGPSGSYQPEGHVRILAVAALLALAVHDDSRPVGMGEAKDTELTLSGPHRMALRDAGVVLSVLATAKEPPADYTWRIQLLQAVGCAVLYICTSCAPMEPSQMAEIVSFLSSPAMGDVPTAAYLSVAVWCLARHPANRAWMLSDPEERTTAMLTQLVESHRDEIDEMVANSIAREARKKARQELREAAKSGKLPSWAGLNRQGSALSIASGAPSVRSYATSKSRAVQGWGYTAGADAPAIKLAEFAVGAMWILLGSQLSEAARAASATEMYKQDDTTWWGLRMHAETTTPPLSDTKRAAVRLMTDLLGVTTCEATVVLKTTVVSVLWGLSHASTRVEDLVVEAEMGRELMAIVGDLSLSSSCQQAAVGFLLLLSNKKETMEELGGIRKLSRVVVDLTQKAVKTVSTARQGHVPDMDVDLLEFSVRGLARLSASQLGMAALVQLGAVKVLVAAIRADLRCTENLLRIAPDQDWQRVYPLRRCATLQKLFGPLDGLSAEDAEEEGIADILGRTEDEELEDGDAGLLALWALLNLSTFPAAQRQIAREGILTLLRTTYASPHRTKAAVASHVLSHIRKNRENVSVFYRAELKMKTTFLLGAAGLPDKDKGLKKVDEPKLEVLEAAEEEGVSGLPAVLEVEDEEEAALLKNRHVREAFIRWTADTDNGPSSIDPAILRQDGASRPSYMAVPQKQQEQKQGGVLSMPEARLGARDLQRLRGYEHARDEALQGFFGLRSYRGAFMRSTLFQSLQASRCSMWKLSSAVDPERPGLSASGKGSSSRGSKSVSVADVLSVVDEEDEEEEDLFDFVHASEEEALLVQCALENSGPSQAADHTGSRSASRPPSALRRPSDGKQHSKTRGISFVQKKPGGTSESPRPNRPASARPPARRQGKPLRPSTAAARPWRQSSSGADVDVSTAEATAAQRPTTAKRPANRQRPATAHPTHRRRPSAGGAGDWQESQMLSLSTLREVASTTPDIGLLPQQSTAYAPRLALASASSAGTLHRPLSAAGTRPSMLTGGRPLSAMGTSSAAGERPYRPLSAVSSVFGTMSNRRPNTAVSSNGGGAGGSRMGRSSSSARQRLGTQVHSGRNWDPKVDAYVQESLMAYNPPKTSRKLLTAECPPGVLSRLEGASEKLASNPSLIRDLLVEEVPQQSQAPMAQMMEHDDLAQAWAEGDAVAAGMRSLSRDGTAPGGSGDLEAAREAAQHAIGQDIQLLRPKTGYDRAHRGNIRSLRESVASLADPEVPSSLWHDPEYAGKVPATVPRPVTIVKDPSEEVRELSRAELRARGITDDPEKEPPRPAQDVEQLQGKFLKVVLGGCEKEPKAVYSFREHAVSGEQAPIIVFEHVDGCRFCEQLYGHFLLPNGRLAHCYRSEPDTRRGRFVNLALPPNPALTLTDLLQPSFVAPPEFTKDLRHPGRPFNEFVALVAYPIPALAPALPIPTLRTRPAIPQTETSSGWFLAQGSGMRFSAYPFDVPRLDTLRIPLEEDIAGRLDLKDGAWAGRPAEADCRAHFDSATVAKEQAEKDWDRLDRCAGFKSWSNRTLPGGYEKQGPLLRKALLEVMPAVQGVFRFYACTGQQAGAPSELGPRDYSRFLGDAALAAEGADHPEGATALTRSEVFGAFKEVMLPMCRIPILIPPPKKSAKRKTKKKKSTAKAPGKEEEPRSPRGRIRPSTAPPSVSTAPADKQMNRQEFHQVLIRLAVAYLGKPRPIEAEPSEDLPPPAGLPELQVAVMADLHRQQIATPDINVDLPGLKISVSVPKSVDEFAAIFGGVPKDDKPMLDQAAEVLAAIDRVMAGVAVSWQRPSLSITLQALSPGDDQQAADTWASDCVEHIQSRVRELGAAGPGASLQREDSVVSAPRRTLELIVEAPEPEAPPRAAEEAAAVPLVDPELNAGQALRRFVYEALMPRLPVVAMSNPNYFRFERLYTKEVNDVLEGDFSLPAMDVLKLLYTRQSVKRATGNGDLKAMQLTTWLELLDTVGLIGSSNMGLQISLEDARLCYFQSKFSVANDVLDVLRGESLSFHEMLEALARVADIISWPQRQTLEARGFSSLYEYLSTDPKSRPKLPSAPHGIHHASMRFSLDDPSEPSRAMPLADKLRELLTLMFAVFAEMAMYSPARLMAKLSREIKRKYRSRRHTTEYVVGSSTKSSFHFSHPVQKKKKPPPPPAAAEA